LTKIHLSTSLACPSGRHLLASRATTTQRAFLLPHGFSRARGKIYDLRMTLHQPSDLLLHPPQDLCLRHESIGISIALYRADLCGTSKARPMAWMVRAENQQEEII
jgi:hypothetical protein